MHLSEDKVQKLYRLFEQGVKPTHAAPLIPCNQRTAIKRFHKWRNQMVAKASGKQAPPPQDPIAARRDKDNVTTLRAALAEAERRAADAEDIRASVLGLMDIPPRPRLVHVHRPAVESKGYTIVMPITDLHYGEVVLLDEMDGLNSYDVQTARRRLGRLADKAVNVVESYYHSTERIILFVGGDLISGDIHPELKETNVPAVPIAVKEAGEYLAGVIVKLRGHFSCPIDIYQAPGNHARTTPKPQSKRRAATSLDLLVGDFAELCVKGAGAPDVTFFRTTSPDAYFSTYGYNWLATHGDAMGAGGGTGYIGASQAIVRGHRKLMDTAWRSGKAIHYVLTGHFHTGMKSPFGWGNGSVVSYSEFSRDKRYDPQAAEQWLLAVHPKHGVVGEHPLYLGHESEGSLYAGPATVVRPMQADI